MMNFTIEKAETFAELIHANQTYQGGSYMIHVNEVKGVVKEFKHLCPTDFPVMGICALLHDTIEDSGKAAKEMYKIVKQMFGEEIANIVWNVTNEIGRNRKEQNVKTYPKIASTKASTFLKLCDRIANARNAFTTKNRMFNVYKEEQIEFKKVIYKAGEFEEMWVVLDKLFEQEVIPF